jgi:hypothetical protein
MDKMTHPNFQNPRGNLCEVCGHEPPKDPLTQHVDLKSRMRALAASLPDNPLALQEMHELAQEYRAMRKLALP